MSGLSRVRLTICEACLDGAGGECHTPGCALWMSQAPDVSLRDQVERVGGGGTLELQGCCRIDGKPFVRTWVDGADLGQLTPAEALNLGIRAIQAGQEAERDAALVRGLIDNGASEKDAAAHLILIRTYRGQVDPDPRSDVAEGGGS